MIPLAKTLNVQVVESSHRHVVLKAPRFTNTVEGSRFSDLAASNIGQLASWTLLQVALRQLDYQPDLQLNKLDWKCDRPQGDTSDGVTATCELPGDKEWQQCLRMLTRKAQSTAQLETALSDGNGTFATLTSEYLAYDLDPA